MKITRQCGLLIALLVMATSAALHPPPSYAEELRKEHRRPNMIAMTDRLKALFIQTRPVCFGRFMVDVPASATIVYGAASAPWPTVRYPGEAGALAARVQEREAEHRAPARYGSDPKSSIFKEILDGAVAGQKIVISRTEFDSNIYRLESFFTVGADLYMQEASASTTDDPLSVASNFTVAYALRNLNEMARSFHPRSDEEIPSQSGMCIEGAFIAETPELTHERARVGVRLKEFPDVHFSIEVVKNVGRIVESNALESRLDGGKREAHADGAGAWYDSIRVFRRGERELAHWSGYEYLALLPPQGRTRALHEFRFIAVGKADDPLTPMLDVELKTGVKDNRSGQVPVSLSDDEIVALWDKLVGTIRVRPASAPVRASEPPASPGV